MFDVADPRKVHRRALVETETCRRGYAAGAAPWTGPPAETLAARSMIPLSLGGECSPAVGKAWIEEPMSTQPAPAPEGAEPALRTPPDAGARPIPPTSEVAPYENIVYDCNVGNSARTIFRQHDTHVHALDYVAFD